MSKEPVKQEISLDVKTLLKSQRELFETGITKTYAFRYNAIRSLYQALKARESDLIKAFYDDIKKPLFEAYVSEIDFVYAEMRYAMGHLKSWMKPRRVLPSLAQFPAMNCSFVSEPYGTVLIIGTWNYPFHLTMAPLVGAIAAGNTAILKPSGMAPATAQFLEEVITREFSPSFVSVVNGRAKETEALLSEKLGLIFFTGSVSVGKIVAAAAAKNLTPTVLELGGKSPCIVHRDVSHGVMLKRAVKRAVWGKYLNAGQTCTAPDYLVVHKDIKAQFLDEMQRTIERFYGKDPESSKDFGRIINERHMDRLIKILNATPKDNVICGGTYNKESLYIAPTILDHVSLDDPIMQEEVFGPIFPVLTYQSIEDLINIIKHHPDPLALYLFTKERSFQREVLNRVSFGGGCVNDTIMHLVNQRLPFGGRGNSGIGSYHGKHTFDAFSHKKSMVKNSLMFDNFLKYPPYPSWKLKLIRKFL